MFQILVDRYNPNSECRMPVFLIINLQPNKKKRYAVKMFKPKCTYSSSVLQPYIGCWMPVMEEKCIASRIITAGPPSHYKWQTNSEKKEVESSAIHQAELLFVEPPAFWPVQQSCADESKPNDGPAFEQENFSTVNLCPSRFWGHVKGHHQ
jgi:hypothetical protein